MQYWIVSHNPHPEHGLHPWNIFYKDRTLSGPSQGDQILFYETAKPFPGRKGVGRKAIVYLAKVSGSIRSREPIGEWKFELPCDEHEDCVIPLEQIRAIVLLPFYRRNITAISQDEFRKLHAMSKFGK